MDTDTEHLLNGLYRAVNTLKALPVNQLTRVVFYHTKKTAALFNKEEGDIYEIVESKDRDALESFIADFNEVYLFTVKVESAA